MNFLFLFVAGLMLNHASALTLRSLYLDAKQQNPAFQSQKLQLEVLQQDKKQLRSATLPNITIEAAYTQLEPSDHYQVAGKDDTRETVVIKGTQNLFSGLKDHYTLQSIAMLISAQDLKIKSQELDLLVEVSQKYFSALLAQEKLVNAQELVNLAKEREEMLRSRVRIGKSRKTELRQATVQTHTYELALQQLQLDLQSSWYAMNSLTNQRYKPEKLAPYITTTTPLKPLDFYLDNLDQHPSVLSQTATVEAMHKQKNADQADYWPTLKLNGNYYAQTPASSSSGSLNPEWDFGLSISYPIFEGGYTRAKVAESALKESQSIIALQELKLKLSEEIKNTYQTLSTQQQQQRIIEQMCDDNKSNLQEIKREYANGLVTSLDVVTALNTYIQSLDKKVENSISLQLNYVLLQTLRGEAL